MAWGAVVLAILALVPSGSAFEARDLLAFSAGPVRFKTKLGLSEQFNDNILYSSGRFSPVQSDFITIINPGIGATLGNNEAGKIFTLDYSFSSLLYAQNSKHNATDHDVNFAANFAGRRLKSTTTGHFGFMSSVLQGYERFEEGIFVPPGNVDRMPYSASSVLDYELTAKTSAFLRGSFNGIEYPNTDRFYSRSDWRVAVGGTYAVTPKWRLLTEGYYGQSLYGSRTGALAGRSNWERVGGNIGVTSPITERLSGTAKVGYEYWDRGQSETGDTLTANVGLSYQVGLRTALSLNFNRSARQSVTLVSQDYISYTGGLGITHQLGLKHPTTLAANANGGVNDRSGGATGTETYLTAGVSASYLVKEWFSVILAYQFQVRDGESVFTRNYSVNTVTLTGVLGY